MITDVVRPSTVRLPEHPPDGVSTIFGFFLQRFPRISASIWRERFTTGKVWTSHGRVATDTPFQPLVEVHYRREVEKEPPVRTDVRIVWQDDHLLVVDKPPHLPVIPGGRWVRNCLLHILIMKTGEIDLTPLHRLDRLTSGLVVFSRNSSTRGHFAQLFSPTAPVEKTYSAICQICGSPPPDRLTLTDHISRSREEYWRQVVLPDQRANAHSELVLLEVRDRLALFRIRLLTGRKHQIRVQLAHAGLPVLGDPLYGTDRCYSPGDLDQRLWLDAHRLRVQSFPAPDSGPPLQVDWYSSRQPLDMLHRSSQR